MLSGHPPHGKQRIMRVLNYTKIGLVALSEEMTFFWYLFLDSDFIALLVATLVQHRNLRMYRNSWVLIPS